MATQTQAQFSFAWPFHDLAVPATKRLVLNPEAQEGLRPSKACAERLIWARDHRLNELQSAVHAGICPRALYESVVLENPAMVAQLERDYFEAAMWEKKRYGDVYAQFREAVAA